MADGIKIRISGDDWELQNTLKNIGSTAQNVFKGMFTSQIVTKGFQMLASGMADDIDAIAKSSGMPKDDIQTIKNHIFFNEHKRYDGVGRLDPDYDMAVAWDRLAAGKPEERDFLLLKHELLESQVETCYNPTMADAHARATKKYDWAGHLFELLGEEGEPDGLL